MKKNIITLITLLLLSGISLRALATAPQTNGYYKVAIMFVVMDDDDDEATVSTIFTTLQAAEKVANLLNVEMSASKDPVTNDLFVFSLKSPEEKDLAMKLIDEEGYEVGQNSYTVTVGTNYSQLNVELLKDGTYTLRMTDAKGAELNQEIVVKRGKISE